MSERDSRAWKAVGEAIEAERTALKMTQKDLRDEANVSISVIAELERGEVKRRRAPGTLARLSEALGWPVNYLDDMLNGNVTPESIPPKRNVDDLASTGETLRSIEEKLDNVNGKLDALLNHYDIVWPPSLPSETSIELEGNGHSHKLPKPEDGGPPISTNA